MFLNSGLTITGGLQFGAGSANDPYFNQVSLLLTGDGTNGAQNNTFIDGSTNNLTVTRAGNTTQGSLSPYGSLWSNYFTGTSGNYIGIADNVALQFGTDNFTIEFWINLSATTGWILGKGNGGATASLSWQVTGTYEFYHSGGTTSLTAPTLALGTWYHIAAVRNGSTISLYVNGTLSTSGSIGANSMNTGGANQLAIGSYSTTAMTGYISNFRIVKGTAVYTGNFTPTTTPLSAITNTSVLTCQSNRFVDNSSNNFTVTVYVVGSGSPSVQKFSPFSPSSPYSSSTLGGSMYFDGGDYLSVPYSTAFDFAAGDFTIECWVYRTGANANSSRIFNSGGDYYGQVDISIDGSGNLASYGTTTGTSWNAWSNGSIGQINLNAWIHIAVVRNGGTVTAYINGVGTALTTTLSTGTLVNGTNAASVRTIGGQSVGTDRSLFGYLSNYRVVKGTAVYTANFTPPTAPLTAIANTQLLLNGTNGGIFDSSMFNDVETVGSAQINTTIVKYGTGSLAFDGSGDYLTMPATPLGPGNFLLGNFTVEGWVRWASVTNGGIFHFYPGVPPSVTTGFALGYDGSAFQVYANATNYGRTYAVTTGVWYHFALVRNSGNIYLYIDGIQQGAAIAASSFTIGNNSLNIGLYFSTSFTLNGYIDDFRVTQGYARYTTNFTPPAEAFPTF